MAPARKLGPLGGNLSPLAKTKDLRAALRSARLSKGAKGAKFLAIGKQPDGTTWTPANPGRLAFWIWLRCQIPSRPESTMSFGRLGADCLGRLEPPWPVGGLIPNRAAWFGDHRKADHQRITPERGHGIRPCAGPWVLAKLQQSSE